MKTPQTPPLIGAINRVAIVTRNLDRFVAFYRDVLDLEPVWREVTPQMRHAILRSGPLSWLQAVEVPENGHGTASDRMFQRGHLDRIALTAASPESFAELRRRLVACGASDGHVDDLGAFQALQFTDPDGMRVELALIVDATLRHFHAPVRSVPADAAMQSIERLVDLDRWPVVERLLGEYVPWVVERLAEDKGVRFGNADEQVAMHNAAFAAEAIRLTSGRGRLLLAHLHGEPAGLVALKPVDAGVAEVKRLYVRPAARGHGIGRALLQRLLADARVEGFHTVRLETLSFMTEARAMYKAFGFVEAPAFADAQAALSGAQDSVHFMSLSLRTVLPVARVAPRRHHRRQGSLHGASLWAQLA